MEQPQTPETVNPQQAPSLPESSAQYDFQTSDSPDTVTGTDDLNVNATTGQSASVEASQTTTDYTAWFWVIASIIIAVVILILIFRSNNTSEREVVAEEAKPPVAKKQQRKQSGAKKHKKKTKKKR